jgi:hypothetical protein
MLLNAFCEPLLVYYPVVHLYERLSGQGRWPPADPRTGLRGCRFSTEYLFSNQGTEKSILAADNLYFAP